MATSSAHVESNETNWGDPKSALAAIKSLVRDVADFPKPGIMFRDIMPIFKCPNAVKAFTEIMAAYIEVHYPNATAIIGLDARGFLFGPIVALQLEKPFIPIRKKGKLPGPTRSVTSVKEYGEDFLEIQLDALTKDDKVVILDDLLATGGTLASSCQLVRESGAEVLGCLCLVGLTDLNGEDKINVPCHSMITY